VEGCWAVWRHWNLLHCLVGPGSACDWKLRDLTFSQRWRFKSRSSLRGGVTAQKTSPRDVLFTLLQVYATPGMFYVIVWNRCVHTGASGTWIPAVGTTHTTERGLVWSNPAAMWGGGSFLTCVTGGVYIVSTSHALYTVVNRTKIGTDTPLCSLYQYRHSFAGMIRKLHAHVCSQCFLPLLSLFRCFSLSLSLSPSSPAVLYNTQRGFINIFIVKFEVFTPVNIDLSLCSV
jgi:hypothetical protein